MHIKFACRFFSKRNLVGSPGAVEGLTFVVPGITWKNPHELFLIKAAIFDELALRYKHTFWIVFDSQSAAALKIVNFRLKSDKLSHVPLRQSTGGTEIKEIEIKLNKIGLIISTPFKAYNHSFQQIAMPVKSLKKALKIRK